MYFYSSHYVKDHALNPPIYVKHVMPALNGQKYIGGKNFQFHCGLAYSDSPDYFALL